MASRLSPLLHPLTLLTALLAASFVPVSGTPTVSPPSAPGLADLRIDFARSHYDHHNCGKPAPGRARSHRSIGDDYIDGLDFVVNDGRDVVAGELPWAVALITRVPSRSAPRLCTGTLVSRRHVASAAHCLALADKIPTNPGGTRCNTTDHLNLHDFMEWSEVKYGGECLHGADASCDPSMVAKSARITSITLFPFFHDDCSHGSDLVILELDEDVDVPHACLPHLHSLEDETLRGPAALASFHTFAWHADKAKGVASADRLRRTALTLKQDRCARKWKTLSTDVLCVSAAEHISQCMGESGSGLLVTSSGRSFLIGVLSSTSACAPAAQQQEAAESRFTDVRLFTATIDRTLGTAGPLPDFSYRKKGTKKGVPWKKARNTTTTKPSGAPLNSNDSGNSTRAGDNSTLSIVPSAKVDPPSSAASSLGLLSLLILLLAL